MSKTKNNTRWNITLKSFRLPLIFLAIFYGVAFWRYLATDKIFYIYNFCYIGTALALGLFLAHTMPRKYILYSRRISQLLVGIYLLGYVGLLRMENLQLEGFIFYLLGGVFAGSTLHYVIAKIFGVVIFGRGWCSWACWTAMVLDFLPWKKSPGRVRKAGVFRYIHFSISLLLVLYFWFILKYRNISIGSTFELYWLAAGNLLYYITGIILAAILKDNRAFCKYTCPIPVLQKLLSRFALLKVQIDQNKCTECGLCEKNCPMDIKILDYKREGKRITSTECIICTTCDNVCNSNAIKFTWKFDVGSTSFRWKEKNGTPLKVQSSEDSNI